MIRKSLSVGWAESSVAAGRTILVRPGAATLSVWRFCHSVGVIAAEPTAVAKTRPSSVRGKKLRLRRSGFFIARQKALIGEGGEDRDHGDAEQRANPVESFEAREIVEKEFQQCYAEECDRGVAGDTSFLPDARAKEDEGKQRPRDRVGHVPREVSGEAKHE